LNSNHSCLLINYAFPPNTGVGGRRWAKLSKYLALQDVKIHVINAEAISDEASPWLEDIYSENIVIHSIKNAKVTGTNRFKNKLLFVAAKIRTKANYADQALWWLDKAYQKAEMLIIEKQIASVIISCPPYHPLFYFSKLKDQFPNIQLVFDYRDLWTLGQNGKGFFSHLTNERFEAEKQMEIAALEKADVIVTVADEISDIYRKVVNHKKVVTIHNGYDPDDFTGMISEKSHFIKEGKINILYAGSIVEDSNVYAKPFFDALAKLKVNDREQYNKINVQIFGSLNSSITNFIDRLEITECLQINQAISSKDINNLSMRFDYLLLFLIPYYKFAFISKAMDYLAARRPIIAVTESGHFSDFLIKHQLGYHCDPQKIDYNWFAQLKQNENLKSVFNPEVFSYRQLANQYYSLLFPSA
jgi:glycosyltransferase involved in cell wall biosynthesis